MKNLFQLRHFNLQSTLSVIIEALGMNHIISDTKAESPCAETNAEPGKDAE